MLLFNIEYEIMHHDRQLLNIRTQSPLHCSTSLDACMNTLK